MAWRSSGASNTDLVNNLRRHGVFSSERVKEAMINVRNVRFLESFCKHQTLSYSRSCLQLTQINLQVDRAHYAPGFPYVDSPQPIGHRATISAPHMHASACESLLPYLNPGAKVLDIGSGSGYLTHVLAELVKPGGKVIGIDHIQELVDLATKNMAKSKEGKELLESGTVEFVKGDGRKGYLEEAPYDAIHVGAAAAEHHTALTDQLKAPGR